MLKEERKSTASGRWFTTLNEGSWNIKFNKKNQFWGFNSSLSSSLTFLSLSPWSWCGFFLFFFSSFLVCDDCCRVFSPRLRVILLTNLIHFIFILSFYLCMCVCVMRFFLNKLRMGKLISVVWAFLMGDLIICNIFFVDF